MPGPFASLFSSPWPTVAVEISPRRVSVVAVKPERKGFVVRAHAIENLPEGLLVPSLTAPNISDVDELGAVVRSALDAIGGRVSQIGLIVPDSAAKVSLVHFDEIPQRADDLRELISWQVRKSAPFTIEDAQLTFAAATTADGAHEFVVAMAKRVVVEQYEAACAAAGVRAGIVDLSTFNLVNAVLAGSPTGAQGDWLLVHINTSYSTIVIVRRGALVFYRNGRTENETELANFVHQSSMYYEDRLEGTGFQRVVVAGGGQDAAGFDALRLSLEVEAGHAVDAIDPSGAARLSPDGVADQSTLDALASPIGLLLRRSAA